MMKNKIFILILILFILTGCTSIYKYSNNEIIDLSLSTKAKPNTTYLGYKFYLPNEMNIKDMKKSNFILHSKEGDYYLYVDLVSYFNKIDNFSSLEEAYYSEIIEYDNKKGLLEVFKKNGIEMLKVSYNYSKIEVISTDIKLSIAKSLLILNSIVYNDNVISNIMENDILNYDEELFSLDNNNTTLNSNFLKYEEEYGIYSDVNNELPDEDKIEVDDID